ncbi:protein Mis18-beta [Protobothrops mucrosquamatus]|uniref:protein Mis18-beta n=1 Tax=Protobothrops mucrosquamatus TaxID=103944 RepID=UPI000775CE12|nr:protein Mis18-beta [Protobothrops mucrosquamatus]
MSVRKKLRLLFEEPQVGGTITVERAGPETRPGCQVQRSPAKWESRGERVPGARGLRLEDCVVYQCGRCRVVLGDSLHLCAQEEKLRLFVCFKVTKDVVVEDNLMVCVEGDLIGCYLLQTTATVEASEVTCPVVSLKEHVEKLKESLIKVHVRMDLLIKKLEEFNQQKITSEKENCKGRPYECTNIKLND